MIELRFNYYGKNLTLMRNGLRIRGIEPEYQSAFRDINRFYREFLQARYRKFAKGGGNWRKLAESTIRRKGHDTILFDTNLMFSVFQPEIVRTTGLTNTTDKLGMIVVASGSGRVYPTSGVSVSKVMGYHQAGGGRLPQRKIVVGMDEATAQKSARRIEKAMKAIAARKAAR